MAMAPVNGKETEDQLVNVMVATLESIVKTQRVTTVYICETIQSEDCVEQSGNFQNAQQLLWILRLSICHPIWKYFQSGHCALGQSSDCSIDNL